MTKLLLIFAAASLLAGETPKSFNVRVTGKGQPMILIPGLASSGDVWNSTVKHFAGRYECHVLTLAGFAGQPPISSPSLDSVRKELAGYIETKQLKRPVIMGHSLGGFLAMWLATEHPDLTGPLIVVDALPFLPAATDPKATVETARPMAEQMRQRIESSEPGNSAQAQYIRQMVTRDADYDVIMDWSRRSHQPTVASAMVDLFSVDLRSRLNRIPARGLVLGTWIAYRQYAPREAVEANYRAQYASWPRAEIVLTDTARHFIMLDDPAWFFEQLESFLSRK